MAKARQCRRGQGLAASHCGHSNLQGTDLTERCQSSAVELRAGITASTSGAEFRRLDTCMWHSQAILPLCLAIQSGCNAAYAANACDHAPGSCGHSRGSSPGSAPAVQTHQGRGRPPSSRGVAGSGCLQCRPRPHSLSPPPFPPQPPAAWPHHAAARSCGAATACSLRVGAGTPWVAFKVSELQTRRRQVRLVPVSFREEDHGPAANGHTTPACHTSLCRGGDNVQRHVQSVSHSALFVETCFHGLAPAGVGRLERMHAIQVAQEPTPVAAAARQLVITTFDRLPSARCLTDLECGGMHQELEKG